MTLSGSCASPSLGGEGVGGLSDSEGEVVVRGKRRAFTTETMVEVSQWRKARSMMRETV